MSKYNEITNAFSAGELGPKAYSRTDLDDYKQGVEEMLNFVPHKTGGAFRRMGTEFLERLGGVGNEAWDIEDVLLIPYRSIAGDFVIAMKIPAEQDPIDAGTLGVPTDNYQTFYHEFDPLQVDTGSNSISINNHGFQAYDRITFSSDDTLPLGLYSNRIYYVSPFDLTINSFKILGAGFFLAPQVILSNQGTGTHRVTISNDFTLGNEPTDRSKAIRVFSRDYNETAATYEQTVIYPGFLLFQEIMFQIRAEYGLTLKGFNYVQYGQDLFINHTSGLVPPLAIRIVGNEPDGRYKFLLYSPLIAPEQELDENYALDNIRSQSTPDLLKALVNSMPFQPQNTDNTIRMHIHANATEGPNDGNSKGLVATSLGFDSLLEARDQFGTNISGFFTDADIGSIVQISYPDSSTPAEPTQGLMYLTGPVNQVFFPGDAINGIVLVGFHPNLRNPAAASHRWNWSSWSPRAGFPRNVAFYQQRLHYSSTLEEPLNIWASQVDVIRRFRYEVLNQDLASDVSKLEFTGPYVDNYPFTAVLASRRVTGINFMIDDDLELRLGTPEGDFVIGFGTESEKGYSRDNKDIRPQSSFGSTGSQVFLGNTRVLYLSQDSSSVRAIDTKSRDYRYLNTDLNVLSDHMRYQPTSSIGPSEVNINSSEFTYLHWQDGESILWAVNSRGTLVGITIDNTLGIAAWHQHQIGGDAKVISVSSAFHLSARHEDVLIVARRNFGTEASPDYRQFIEAIGETFNHVSLITDDTDPKATEDKPRYLDAMVKINQTSSKIVSAPHLANQTVSIFFNGTYVEDVTLNNSGNYTLPDFVTEAIIGYKYTSRLKTLNLDRGQQLGSSRGNIARTDKVTVSLYNSSYGLIKDGEDGTFNSLELDVTSLYNGDIRHDLSQSSSREPKIVIETDKPLPLNILGITTRGVSYDG